MFSGDQDMVRVCKVCKVRLAISSLECISTLSKLAGCYESLKWINCLIDFNLDVE